MGDKKAKKMGRTLGRVRKEIKSLTNVFDVNPLKFRSVTSGRVCSRVDNLLYLN